MRAGSQNYSIIFFSRLYLIMTFSALMFPGCLFLEKGIISEKKIEKQIEHSYFENGSLEYEAAYLNGKLDGTSRVWSEEGILLSESEYSNGKPHGIWKKYFTNGNIMYEVRYFHAQKHGFEKWFYENQQLKSEQEFEYGESKSPIIRWDPEGSLLY